MELEIGPEKCAEIVERLNDIKTVLQSGKIMKKDGAMLGDKALE